MRLTLSLLLIVSTFYASSQSLSGNLRSNESESSLTYGNVDIYQDDILVASVLTDKLGNFNVALDSGNYVCVINYAGHKPVKKEVRVEKDEISDFSLDADPSKPKLIAVETKTYKRAETYDSVEMAEISVMESRDVRMKRLKGGFVTEGIVDGDAERLDRSLEETEIFDGYIPGGKERRQKAKSGSLTAGEINDFSKWEMWKDIREDQLKAYGRTWKIRPNGRYTLLLQNQVGLPLADAKVDLIEGNNTVVFSARTDNTGQAELWLTTKGEVLERSNISMRINYRGKTEKIRNVKPFSEEINYHTMEVECNEMNNVDIAFVVDATGSMSDELSYLQAEMNDVIYKSKKISKKLNFHFANVFYRDEGNSEEYCTRSMDFSRVLSESVQFINHQGAGGGGDYEEAVEIALDTAINHLSWSEEARCRVIFLILDAPPHNVERNRVKLDSLMREAAKKGIRIVPVGASGINKGTEYLLRTLALGTNGTYTFLTSHSGIGNAHMEPTTDGYKVETFNELMVRVLKSYTYMADCEQNLPELDLDYPDSLVEVIQPVDSSQIIDSADVREHHHTNPFPEIRWSYYPNPTTGILNITADSDIEELFLTDLSGKLLKSIKRLSKNRVYRLDMTDLTTGIYLIRYLHKDRWMSGKVMLQR